MSSIRLPRRLFIAIGIAALLVGATATHAQQYDSAAPYSGTADQDYAASDQAPGRVARLAYLSGQVQFAPAGETDWGTADVNRPMVIGDRLLTGDDGRAVLELGDASVRIDNDSAFDFLNLAQGNVQIELSQGTLNLAVRQMDQGANFEVDTPTVAFVAATPGVYRIDDNPDGTGSMVTVFQGSGTVYGENGVSRQVAAGTSYRFNDSALASVDVTGIPQPDDFDRFCEARDASYGRYAQQSQQYVAPDMIGGDDLYQYGQWNDVPEYGNVWYPTAVPVGWAPYRDGHWAWIDPWGWTWVDDAPWGFAPFHYGRWAYIGSRWGWIPGPVNVRPWYAPALVAFVGGAGWSVGLNLGGGAPVGWFPLGPRDVYTPWFPASRGYFTNVNVTNIRNVYVNRTVINNYYADYRAGRVPPRGGQDFAYRTLPGAVTAVPRNVFTGARPVQPAVLRLDRTQLTRGEVAFRPGANPDRASLGLRNATTSPTVIRNREPFARPVVARSTPPPRPVEFAAREKVIAAQHGQPLTPAQVQTLRREQPAPRNGERVKLVPALAGAAAGAAAIGAMQHRGPNPPGARPEAPREVTTPRAGQPAAGTGQTPAPFRNTVRPIVVPGTTRPAPPRPNELPSARFAPSREPATLPRAPVIQPADESRHNAPTERTLPVARPIERAPQASNARPPQRTVQQAPQPREPRFQAPQQLQQRQAAQREAQMQEQQRAREQAMQQQREVQQQAQQRDMQAQQERQFEQRNAQTQAQQRAMQMQQQRASEQQAQQREAQMQQRMRPPDVQRAPPPQYRAPAPRAEPQNRREPPASHHPADDNGHPIR